MIEKLKYAVVAIQLPIRNLYSYSIPDNLKTIVNIGSIVKVNVRNQIVRGCVIDIKEQKTDEQKTDEQKSENENIKNENIKSEKSADEKSGDAKSFKMKPIIDVISPSYKIDENLIKLSNWMIEYYLAFPGPTLSCVSFIGFNNVHAKMEKLVRIRSVEEVVELLESDDSSEDESPQNQTEKNIAKSADKKTVKKKIKLTVKQIQVLESILDNGNAPLPKAEIEEQSGAGESVISKLIDKGILEIVEEEKIRQDSYTKEVMKSEPLILNPEQQKAFSLVKTSINERKNETFLLYGVTGSGKTEIYLQSIALCLGLGREAIVLVPEISLTPQTVERFRGRFGNIVGVYHSRLSIGQKYDLYRQIERGEVKIVIGARSALFTPFKNLGVIIVDEEHESTFKQDSDPRYQSRDVAVMRGLNENAVVILGSATPSLESFFNAQKGKYTMLTLSARVENIPMPPVKLIDMAAVIKSNPDEEILSGELRREIKNTLDRKEQAILFINRRGFFNFYTCMQCRFLLKCFNCDMTLTYHKGLNKMICHICGKKYDVPIKCPSCQSPGGAMIGAGIQRIEEVIRTAYPEARIVRVDLDTTQTRTAFIEKWNKIVNHEVDIIIGTQMIAKGFHLEKVTLVGVVLADVGLHVPDFRATERTFSLMMQVAGRTGRGDYPGKVLIQTYHPEHYALNWAKEHNYEAFAQKELHIRKMLQFPPHYKLTAIIISGKTLEIVKAMADKAAGFLRHEIFARQDKSIAVIGPAPSPISKIMGAYRYRLLLRGNAHTSIKKYINALEEKISEWPNRSAVRVVFDVDPFDLL